MSEYRRKGLEKVLKYFDLTDEDLEFIGRVHSLESDPNVIRIEIVGKSLTKYNVLLRLGHKELKREKWLENHGFPKPDHRGMYDFCYNISGKEYRMRIIRPSWLRSD